MLKFSAYDNNTMRINKVSEIIKFVFKLLIL